MLGLILALCVNPLRRLKTTSYFNILQGQMEILRRITQNLVSPKNSLIKIQLFDILIQDYGLELMLTEKIRCTLIIGTIMTFKLWANPPELNPREGNQTNNVVRLGPLEIPAVLVKGGTFEMGDMFGDGSGDELPVHKVTVTDFYMSITEVTIGQYKRYCLKTGKAMPQQEEYTKDDYPIAFVTWIEAQDFCTWAGGSLPTEAQWEYAARAGGLTMKYPTGATISHDQANYFGTGGIDKWKKSSPVAKFPPNSLGIYDLAGNLYEWCYDYYKSNYYEISGQLNPSGPPSGMFKVVRGGSWYHDQKTLRTAHRYRYLAVSRLSFVGFRIVWKATQLPVSE